MGVVSVEYFWCASVCGFVFVVGSVGTFLLFIFFLCTTRRHERPLRGFLADEFFYGECLQGTWVEGELLGKFQSRETRTNAAFNQLPLDRLWTSCFTAFRPCTGKSLLLRRLESSKFPRDASSWARRAQLRIRVQASHTSAYFGRASFE